MILHLTLFPNENLVEKNENLVGFFVLIFELDINDHLFFRPTQSRFFRLLVDYSGFLADYEIVLGSSSAHAYSYPKYFFMKDNYITIKAGPCFHRIAFDSIFYVAVKNRYCVILTQPTCLLCEMYPHGVDGRKGT
jgi:hypothetical protein